MTLFTNITRTLLQLLFLSLIISFALGVNYLLAWTGPTGTAPNNNAAAPINVGTTPQVKLESLSVGKSAPTATDYGLISYGKIRSTIGGVEFPDGTVQATAGLTSTNCTTSPELAVGWNSSATWNHGLGARPTLMMPYLVNKVADKGYVPGDMVYLGTQTGDVNGAAGVTLLPSSTAVTILWQNTGAVNATEYIINKSPPHSYSYILNTSWRLVLRVCVL